MSFIFRVKGFMEMGAEQSMQLDEVMSGLFFLRQSSAMICMLSNTMVRFVNDCYSVLRGDATVSIASVADETPLDDPLLLIYPPYGMMRVFYLDSADIDDSSSASRKLVHVLNKRYHHTGVFLHGSPCYYLASVVILPRHRLGGRATQMLKYFFSWCRATPEAKRHPCFLEVEADNNAAIRLYEKFGFVKVAQANVADESIDVLLMKRPAPDI